MKIYTKTGDKGKTSLFGKTRVDKDDVRIESYGTVDELNSHIGVLHAQINLEEVKQDLLVIQSKLFDVGANLAADPDSTYPLPIIELKDTEFLEGRIDKVNEVLPALKTFILPSGSSSCGAAHVCRTVCRRSERRVVSLSKIATVDPVIIIYLNRLSDYFFVLSRFLLQQDNIDEIPWISE